MAVGHQRLAQPLRRSAARQRAIIAPSTDVAARIGSLRARHRDRGVAARRVADRRAGPGARRDARNADGGKGASRRSGVRTGRARALAAAFVPCPRRGGCAAARRCPRGGFRSPASTRTPTWRACSRPNDRTSCGSRRRFRKPLRTRCRRRSRADCRSSHRISARSAIASMAGRIRASCAGTPRQSEWNDALFALHRPRRRCRVVRVASWPSDYRERYLAPIDAASRRVLQWPQLDAHHFEAASDARSRRELSLAELVTAGVACGKAEARTELAPCRARARRRLRRAAHAVEGLIDALSQADRETAAARARVDELETSTTWRMTAPVRSGRAWREGVRQRAGARRSASCGQLAASRVARDDAAARRRSARAWRAHRAASFEGGQRFRPTRSVPYTQADAIAPLAFAPAAHAARVDRDPRLRQAAADVHLPSKRARAHAAGNVRGDRRRRCVARADAGSAGRRSPACASSAIARNLGFIGSCNRGVELARGEFVVLLNNDTIVTEGWLDALAARVRVAARCRLVGAKLVYPDGRLQEAGGIVWRDGSAWNVGRDDDPDTAGVQLPARGRLRLGRVPRDPRPRCSASSAASMTRYAPAYYEDTDLAFAVRAAGRRVYYQPDATIVHFEGQTSGTDAAPASSATRSRIAWRSATSGRRCWRRIAATASNAELERDRNAKRRVLFVDACMLTPDQDSRLGAHARDAGADGRRPAQGHVRRRQSRASPALRAAAAAARRRGRVRALRPLGQRAAARRAAASSTSSCSRATTSQRGTSTTVATVRAAGAARVRHGRPALPARGAARGARAERRRATSRPDRGATRSWR